MQLVRYSILVPNNMKPKAKFYQHKENHSLQSSYMWMVHSSPQYWTRQHTLNITWQAIGQALQFNRHTQREHMFKENLLSHVGRETWQYGEWPQHLHVAHTLTGSTHQMLSRSMAKSFQQIVIVPFVQTPSILKGPCNFSSNFPGVTDLIFIPCPGWKSHWRLFAFWHRRPSSMTTCRLSQITWTSASKGRLSIAVKD